MSSSPDPPPTDSTTEPSAIGSPPVKTPLSRLLTDPSLQSMWQQQAATTSEPDWLRAVSLPEYREEFNQAVIPIVLFFIMAVAIAVIAPIVRIVQDLTAVGFGWALGWMLTGLIIAAVWLVHELDVWWRMPRALRTGVSWYAFGLRLIAFVLAGLATITVAVLFAMQQPYAAVTVAVAGTLVALYIDDPDRMLGWLTVKVPVQPFGKRSSDLTTQLTDTFNSAVLPYIFAPAFTLLVARSWSLSAGLLIVIVGTLSYFVARSVWKHRPARSTALVLLITLTSLVFSWGLLSAVHSRRSAINTEIPSAAARKTEIARRIALQAGWRGPTVAVALSGGGYRAALTHAGLLAALDEAQIPVHILSTVSGGSIVGGSYAAGWTPAQFHRYLAGTRPGLPLDVLHAGNVIRRAISRRHGSGETFAAHLSRNFFADVALGDVGPPTLVVNATNFNDGTRASFWPHQSQPIGDLAHLVAASGAFPGAFDPVYLGDAPYVDGGVMENLGVDGLQQYLADPSNASVPTPSVLIVSDVSAEPAPPAGDGPPPMLASILRAEDLVYQRLHERIFALYTGDAYKPREPMSRHGYELDAGKLWPGRTGRVRVFIVSPTSAAERNQLTKDDRPLAQSVANISTLFEPSTTQVDAAFWLGAHVARTFLPEICASTRTECPALAALKRP